LNNNDPGCNPGGKGSPKVRKSERFLLFKLLIFYTNNDLI
jgi:hypothetical protein